jgi:hypothetical protein
VGVPPPPLPPLLLLEELPHPLSAISDSPNSNAPRQIAGSTRLRALCSPPKNSPGTSSANRSPLRPRRDVFAAAVAAVVLIVSLVLAAPPFGVTLAGLNEQLAPAGSPVQLAALNVIVLLNPFTGVIVSVVLPLCPGALTLIVPGLAPNVKSGMITVSVAGVETEPPILLLPS